MNDEKWHQLVDNIETRFEIMKRDSEPIIYDNLITNKEEEVGRKETIVFKGPAGDEQKIERVLKKVVIDKKMHYHKTKSDAITEFIYSPNEYSDSVKVYKRAGDEWLEIKE